MVKKKIMAEIVATNVVASRPPERRPTATPTARANKDSPLIYISNFSSTSKVGRGRDMVEVENKVARVITMAVIEVSGFWV